MKIKVNSELSQTIQDIDFTGSTAANSELVKAILLLAHPVGSYYWSSNSTSPATLFGGTWTQIKDKFIIAVGDSHTAGTSYGSNTKDISHTHSYAHTHGVPGVAHTHTSAAHTHTTGNHTLTTTEMPSHAHSLMNYNASGNESGYNYVPNIGGGSKGYYNMGTGNNGGGGAHNHGDTGSTTPGATGSTTPSATTTNSQSTSTSGSGGSTSLDITPACIAAYCWRRTA